MQEQATERRRYCRRRPTNPTTPYGIRLPGENEILTFADALCGAVRYAVPDYDFSASEYLPFMDKDNFITILANALIDSMENLHERVTLILDDLHTIQSGQVKEFLACFMKYLPGSIRMLLGSREVIWQELTPLYLKGDLFELNQNELAFTKSEAALVLGVDDEKHTTSQKDGLSQSARSKCCWKTVTPADVPSRGKEALYSYLFYECVSRLSPETVEFLKASACFEELDAPMLDAVLNINNSKQILESLVSRNMFTTKTGRRSIVTMRFQGRVCLERQTDRSSWSCRRRRRFIIMRIWISRRLLNTLSR